MSAARGKEGLQALAEAQSSAAGLAVQKIAVLRSALEKAERRESLSKAELKLWRSVLKKLEDRPYLLT